MNNPRIYQIFQLYIFFRSSDGAGFGDNGAIVGKWSSSYVDGEYDTLQFTFPSRHYGKTITSLRLDPYSGDTTIGKTFTIDYIYIGPADKAPSTYEGNLLFDFKNDEEAERRYASGAYGDRNFDQSTYSTSALSSQGIWYINGNQVSNVDLAGETIALTMKDGANWGYLATAQSLKYYTNPGDIVQVRFKTLNMELPANTAMRMQFFASTDAA